MGHDACTKNHSYEGTMHVHRGPILWGHDLHVRVSVPCLVYVVCVSVCVYLCVLCRSCVCVSVSVCLHMCVDVYVYLCV